MDPEIKIRGYHTDLFQHVNNARYLEFLEEGRWEIIEKHLDLDAFTNKGLLFFVVNINISYRSQARMNDVVVVKSGLEKIGNRSVVVRQYVLNKTTGLVCAEADVTFVITDRSQNALEITGDLKAKIEKIPPLEPLDS